MRNYFRLTLFLIVCVFLISCKSSRSTTSQRQAEATPNPIIIPVSDGFDYPFGSAKYSKREKHEAGWYDAQGFGANNHLGEDWKPDYTPGFMLLPASRALFGPIAA